MSIMPEGGWNLQPSQDPPQKRDERGSRISPLSLKAEESSTEPVDSLSEYNWFADSRRIGRGTFWAVHLLVGLIICVAYLLIFNLITVDSTQNNWDGLIPKLYIAVPIALLVEWVVGCAQANRLRDINGTIGIGSFCILFLNFLLVVPIHGIFDTFFKDSDRIPISDLLRLYVVFLAYSLRAMGIMNVILMIPLGLIPGKPKE